MGDQIARLFRIVVILQTEPGLNAGELAGRCEVSRRTIYRDLDHLKGAGVPVGYRQEDLGYRLKHGYFLQPPGLTEGEALALTVLARQFSAADGLGLLRQALGGAVKVVQGLSPEVRDRVIAATGALRFGAVPAPIPIDRQRVRDALLGSLTRRTQVRIWHRSPETLAEECTKFAIYRLLIHERHWFLVGRSSLRRRIEVIGAPWIDRAVLTDELYAIPPGFRLERFLGRAWGVDRGAVRYRARLRFSGRVAPVVEEAHRHRALARQSLPGGGVELEFLVDGLDEILRWAQGYGDDVEVLEPRELRDRLREVATAVARRHQPER